MKHPVTDGETETQRGAGICPGPPSQTVVPLGFGPKSEFIQSKDVRDGTPVRTDSKVRLGEGKQPTHSQISGQNQRLPPTHILEMLHLHRQPRETHKAGVANSSV